MGERYEKTFWRVALEDFIRAGTAVTIIFAALAFLFSAQVNNYIDQRIEVQHLAPATDVIVLNRKQDKLEEGQDKLKEGQVGLRQNLERLNTQIDSIEKLAQEQRSLSNTILLELRKP